MASRRDPFGMTKATVHRAGSGACVTGAVMAIRWPFARCVTGAVIAISCLGVLPPKM